MQGDELTSRDVGKLLYGPHRGTVRALMVGCQVWRRGLTLSVETPEMRDRRRAAQRVGRGWALMATVCVLKHVAKHHIANEPRP